MFSLQRYIHGSPRNWSWRSTLWEIMCHSEFSTKHHMGSAVGQTGMTSFCSSFCPNKTPQIQCMFRKNIPCALCHVRIP